MITLLTGENSFEIDCDLKRLMAAFEGAVEKFDGVALELKQLPELLTGQSLFAEKRLVVIRELSKKKQLWDELGSWLERVSDDIQLVLVEPAPDKRTKTYKALQKHAEVRDFQLWSERDARQAEKWIIDEARRLGMKLDSAAARALLERSFVATEKGQSVIDQWQIIHSLEKLSVLETVTADTVKEYIDDQPVDSVFRIFETALTGDAAALHALLVTIEPQEDPFKVFGLLSGQVFQLAALAVSTAPTSDTAKAIGVHPYAAGKLAGYAKMLKGEDIRRMALAFADTDEAMKRSKAGPWILIEQALMKVALLAKPNKNSA